MTRIALVLACAIAAGAASAETSGLTDKQIAGALAQAECSVPLDEVKQEMTATALDDGQTLVELPCNRGAYNFLSIFMAVPTGAPEKASLLRFQIWEGKGFRADYSLTNPDFDAKAKRLTMYHKSRGIGDCGTAGEWQWVGTDFKMTGFWVKNPCDGREFGFGSRNFERWRVFPPRRK
jgi:hypothetical protein